VRPPGTGAASPPSSSGCRTPGAKALRDANPYLRKLSEVPDGTLVVVPERDHAADGRSTDMLESLAGTLVVERLRRLVVRGLR
jgi:hypothetical protein